MRAEPIAFVSFPSVAYEARENFKVLDWCSRYRYDLISLMTTDSERREADRAGS